MSRRAASILLSPEERARLETWAHARSLPQRVVQRAQIILMAAAGILNQEIGRRLRVSRPTVQLWRQRFLALRLPGLEKDAPRPGRIPRLSARQVRAVVEATLHTRPPQATHLRIPMKLVSDSDWIPVTHSDAMPVTIGAKRRWRSYSA